MDSVRTKEETLLQAAVSSHRPASTARSVEKKTQPTAIAARSRKLTVPKRVKYGDHGRDDSARTQATKIQGPKPQGGFKTPLINNTVLPKSESRQVTPRHDPGAPGALVMTRPESVPAGKQIVDVVVDPIISSSLRPHQREGVQFLYESVMGMREPGMCGSIMADEMGLGKTFQTITLLWTLLKQNPVYGEPAVIKKALIVCPVTLIKNWRKEFRKWLGLDRIGVFVFDDNKRRLTDFTKGRSWSIMIIGYEKLRSISEDLRAANCIDIIIADEGHRLKTAKNKSAQAIMSLDVSKKFILSGTPMQNDLSEFFFVVDFVNPGVLGTYKRFVKDFEVPIIKSRQPGAQQAEVEKGEAAGEMLASLTTKFILRRTAEILSKYLPMKTEYVLLCRPTKAQTLLYEHILSSSIYQSALGSSEVSFQLITILKKVCNSPYLLKSDDQEVDKVANDKSLSATLVANLPPKLVRNNHGSTKLRTLDRMLYGLRQTTSEKVVIVSNYTSVLSILESFLTSLGYSYLRLDGSTPAKKRQDLVDDFNNSDASSCFAFLLSAKAGGLGLNLIGASRLVLFDTDWNPAIDLQAMARIHRDGQRRPCKIYRLFLAGGIDEKMWQRQVTKLGLANNIMDQKAGASSFSKEELHDLFTLDQGPSCQTHSLLNCQCGGKGVPEAAEEVATEVEESDLPNLSAFISSNKVDIEEQERRIAAANSCTRRGAQGVESLMSYMHFETSNIATNSDEDLEALIDDDILVSALKDEDNQVSFVFAKSSSQT